MKYILETFCQSATIHKGEYEVTQVYLPLKMKTTVSNVLILLSQYF